MSNSEVSDGKIFILYLVKHAPGVSYQMLMDKCLESLYLDSLQGTFLTARSTTRVRAKSLEATRP